MTSRPYLTLAARAGGQSPAPGLCALEIPRGCERALSLCSLPLPPCDRNSDCGCGIIVQAA